MSGFCGIVSGNGLDQSLLRRMTDALVFRGPDDQRVWSCEEAGFGHTLLQTTPESKREKQPCTLDGNAWITADCRIDAQDDLRAKLQAKGRRLEDATDPELILHAWHVWGDDCVKHLSGDFAFAIWDSRKRRLYCARDHWGIKLFYYSASGGGLVFSNTLNCVRLDPGVSERWNDRAICDFLLFGSNRDPASTTTFADIQCLPPAHVLTWEAGDLKLRRYWSLPIDEPIRYRRSRDYVERFQELLATAVRDRLRTDKAVVMMSGGLDSPILAATAKRVLSAAGGSFDLQAHTIVYRELIPDSERAYAEMAARHIGIPLHVLTADDYRPYERWNEMAREMPEPDHNPLRAMNDDFNRRIASHCRVVFYGEGPDNLLRYEWKPYLAYLRRRGQYTQAAADLMRSFWGQKRLPFAFSLRRRVSAGSDSRPQFPEWIRPDVVQRFDLRQRWNAFWEPTPPVHPYHPYAYNSMFIANWLHNFTDADPGVSGALFELRHPYLDLRVARYLLSLPVLPWCRRKHIMREAARELLPEPIQRREKTPLAGDPLGEHHKLGRFSGIELPPLEAFSQYVTAWPRLDADNSWSSYLSLVPISLGLWWKARKPGVVAGG